MNLMDSAADGHLRHEGAANAVTEAGLNSGLAVVSIAKSYDKRAVLLDVSDDVMRERLSRRESLRSLEEHLARNLARRAFLEQEAPPWVTRVATDEKPLDDLALHLARLAHWL